MLTDFVMIPRELMRPPKVKADHIYLLSIIYGLSLKDGECYASSEYLSERSFFTVRKVEDLLKKLEDFELIERKKRYYPKEAKSKRIIKVKTDIYKLIKEKNDKRTI